MFVGHWTMKGMAMVRVALRGRLGNAFMLSLMLVWVVVGPTFAGSNPKMLKSGGSNQSTVKTGCQTGKKTFVKAETEKPRYQNGPQSLSRESLLVEVPQISLTIFDKKYSVGGHCVQLPVELVADDYFGSYSTQASWNYPENILRMRASDYDQICYKNQVCNKNGDYQGLKVASDESFWEILHHEALHADFIDKYSSLIEDDLGYATFITEMLSYVGANGYDEKFAAEHILKSNTESYSKARYWAKKYLGEMNAKQCTNEKDILKKMGKMGDSESDLPKPRWQCDVCGTVFETGEDLARHLLGDCPSALKKEKTTEGGK